MPVLPLLTVLPLLLVQSPSRSRTSSAAAEARVGLMPLRTEEAPLARMETATAMEGAAAVGLPSASSAGSPFARVAYTRRLAGEMGASAQYKQHARTPFVLFWVHAARGFAVACESRLVGLRSMRLAARCFRRLASLVLRLSRAACGFARSMRLSRAACGSPRRASVA